MDLTTGEIVGGVLGLIISIFLRYKYSKYKQAKKKKTNGER